MAKEIDKIIQSKTAPKSNNVLWDDGENLKINRNGKWENTGAPMINITYANLVELRNNNKLVAGMQYRITDYETTTTQADARSAGHQFDVIVLALSENTLTEEAYAIQSARDTDGYFANSYLAAWKLWYCLDNNAERFAWADVENGKGVIYRMIDEWNNDIPYDFKNIIYVEKAGFKYSQWGGEYQFIRNSALDKVIDGTQYYGYSSETTPTAWSEGKCWVTDIEITSNTQLYKEDGSAISYGGTISNITAKDAEYYTFRKDNEDDSLYGITKDNVVEARLQNGTQLLNKNIFGVGCYANKLGNDSFNNTFGDNCHENTLLGGFIEERGTTRYCANNSFGNGCCLNVFGYASFGNTFGENCNSNSFGNDFNNNNFGSNCDSNIFGNDCGYNDFAPSCSNNSFGNYCVYNICGLSFDSNSFGNACNDNSFGDECRFNSFGNACAQNSFDEKCNYNSFSNNCKNVELSIHTNNKAASVNSNEEVKVFNLADLADLLNS